LSSELAGIVERVAPSIVRIEDGSRLTATGLIWSAEGVIVTTSHGVERDEDLAVERADGTVLPATLVGRDPDTDIAVLRVAATGLPAITPADANEVKVGQLALALGRPGRSGLQATIGIISARQESQTHGQPGYIVHTDALLYPGFSGGPLVDVSGRVVGMTDRMFGRGIGIALGTPIVEQVATALLKHGHIRRGYLGVRTQLVGLPENLRQALNLSQERGLLVVQVETGSPAEQAGLLLGDTLLRINDQPLQDVDALRSHLQAGQTITIHILRGGEARDVQATLVAAE
jgi:S1-C subfamily serine protease